MLSNIVRTSLLTARYLRPLAQQSTRRSTTLQTLKIIMPRRNAQPTSVAQVAEMTSDLKVAKQRPRRGATRAKDTSQLDKLVEEPYVDENDSSELSDAPEEPLTPVKRRSRSAVTKQPTAPKARRAIKSVTKTKVDTATAAAPETSVDSKEEEFALEEKPNRTPKRKTAVEVVAAKTEAEAVIPTIDTAHGETQVEGDREEASAAEKPKRTRKRKLAVEEASVSTLVEEGEAPEGHTFNQPSPAKKSRQTRKRKTAVETTTTDSNGTVVSTALDAEGVVIESTEEPKPKRKRAVKPKAPIVYDIPEVERKETNFKGRLGYVNFFIQKPYIVPSVILILIKLGLPEHCASQH